MDPRLTCQPTRVAIGNRAEEGFLIFADDCLVAVITHLQRTVSEDLRCHWFLEAGFGPCAAYPPPEFDTPDEVQRWVLARLAAHNEVPSTR